MRPLGRLPITFNISKHNMNEKTYKTQDEVDEAIRAKEHIIRWRGSTRAEEEK